MTEIHVSDHAVLRYLERAHGLDVDAIRQHMAGLSVNAARLGAIAVKIENVKLVLVRRRDDVTDVVTVLEPSWRTYALDSQGKPK